MHYEAPQVSVLESGMKKFCDWFKKEKNIDVVLKAAIAHFYIIHPSMMAALRGIQDLNCKKYSGEAAIKHKSTNYFWQNSSN